MTDTRPIGPIPGSPAADPHRPQPSDPPNSQRHAPDVAPAPTVLPPESARAVEPAAVLAATERLNDLLRSSSRIHFEVGDGELQVQVVDSRTDEVIRSIPGERVLEIRDHLRALSGLLLDEHA
ncbi:MAG: flagellar protein FlaG [Planctomycetota bacterium]